MSFTARPGKEADLDRVLSDKEVVRSVTAHMGATLEAIFVQGSRFTEIFDVPGAAPTIARSRLLEAHGQPEVHAFLRRFAPLLDDPFQPDDPSSFAAWVQRHKLRCIVDARSPERAPERSPPMPALPLPAGLPPAVPPLAPKTSFERVSIGAAPR